NYTVYWNANGQGGGNNATVRLVNVSSGLVLGVQDQLHRLLERQRPGRRQQRHRPPRQREQRPGAGRPGHVHG
ncbi:hypothetical protein AB4Z54_67410, partial [Streptomyces sp. MCAF7]